MKENNKLSAEPRRDINSKTVLGNPVLYAQFLRDNINIPCLKHIQPEDIEDVSERYRPYLGTEFESDTVKRVSAIPPSFPSSIMKGKPHGRPSASSAPGYPAGSCSESGSLTSPMKWCVSMTTVTRSCLSAAMRCH